MKAPRFSQAWLRTNLQEAEQVALEQFLASLLHGTAEWVQSHQANFLVDAMQLAGDHMSVSTLLGPHPHRLQWWWRRRKISVCPWAIIQQRLKKNYFSSFIRQLLAWGPALGQCWRWRKPGHLQDPSPIQIWHPEYSSVYQHLKNWHPNWSRHYKCYKAISGKKIEK